MGTFEFNMPEHSDYKEFYRTLCCKNPLSMLSTALIHDVLAHSHTQD